MMRRVFASGMLRRVFARLAHCAMQLGGLVRFEHISLVDEGALAGEREGLHRMTTQACLDYASQCASSSAHVWFQFVMAMTKNILKSTAYSDF